MSNKNASKMVVLALVASIFGVPLFANAFTTPATSTSVDNIAPVFTNATDNGSDATTPTNVGSNVTFTGTATDSNGDMWYLAICKTQAVVAGDNDVPTCSGGAWVISTETASGAQASVTYTTLVGDAESNDWYAYACDKVQGGGSCTEDTSTDMPFKVNHAGTFGTVAVTDYDTEYLTADTVIEPGEAMTFTLANADIADPDSDGTQDLISMYVCTDATTAFDYSANSCTGGATVCSVTGVDPTTTDAVCTGGASLNTIPKPHGSYNFKVYVEDTHSFPSGGTNQQSYTVVDVAPFITGSNQYTVTDISLAAGASTAKSYTAIVKDNNGDDDITAAVGVLYDDAAINLSSGTCTLDENDCYSGVSCVLSNQTGADTDATATCDFTVWYNANYSLGWALHLNPADQLGSVTDSPDSSAIQTNSLQALNITTATIAYGTVALGGTSAGVTTTIENQGNQILDVMIQGTDMAGVPTGTIVAAQQKWHNTTLDFTYASAGNALVNSSAGATTKVLGCADRNIAVRPDHTVGTSSDENMYWKIQIPATQVAGSYSGTNTFAAAGSSQCADGE